MKHICLLLATSALTDGSIGIRHGRARSSWLWDMADMADVVADLKLNVGPWEEDV
jgi:hypothetical protein